jgi:hypothetical protein
MMPIIQGIRINDLIKINSAEALDTIMKETDELFIRNHEFGVSIQNSESSVILESKIPDDTRTFGTIIKFNELCSVTILNHKHRDPLLVPYIHKPIITDIIEIQFTGHLHGITVPVSDKGLEVLRAKMNDVDMSHTHGYRMSVFAYNLNTHQAIIKGGISR